MKPTIFLLVCLLLALAIVLGNRRITTRHAEWWAIQLVAVCAFLVGRLL